jgi:hypothetical protein
MLCRVEQVQGRWGVLSQGWSSEVVVVAGGVVVVIGV